MSFSNIFLYPNTKTIGLNFITSLVVNLTSRLRAGSQQVDHVQVMANVDQDL